MIDNIIDHIRKAQIEAQKQHFKANTIIIDTDLARANEIYFPTRNGYAICPSMIMGLAIHYQNNLTHDYGVNFIITETHTQNDELSELRKENKILREKLNKLKEVFENDR